MGQSQLKSANKNQIRQNNAPLHINLLPEKLLIYIFSFLDVKTLGVLAHVSTFWNALAEEDMLWKALYEKH